MALEAAAGVAQACTPCPPNMLTAAEAATSAAACVCKAGYYLRRGTALDWLPEPYGGDCIGCPSQVRAGASGCGAFIWLPP